MKETFKVEIQPPEGQKKEHVLAGVCGAFLFSLVGVGLYFLIYQLGFIAGICGFIMVALGVFGYQLFSGRKNSMRGVIIACIIAIIMLMVAEYISVGYLLYDELRIDPELADQNISFFMVMRVMPEAFKESEFRTAVLKEFGVAVVLYVLAAGSYIYQALKRAKAESAAEVPAEKKPPVEF